MRSKVCADASLIVAMLVPERFSLAALNLWSEWMRDDAEIIAPTLLRYEVASAIYRKSLNGLISEEDARNTLGQFLEMDIVYLDPVSLPIRAFEIAEQFDRMHITLPWRNASNVIFGQPMRGCTTRPVRIFNTSVGSAPRFKLEICLSGKENNWFSIELDMTPIIG